MHYTELRKINVNDYIERKNGLAYLSWSWAVDQLLQLDESASWEYAEPRTFGETMMVFCTVHAFGKSRTAQLPVMDFRNKAIHNPDAFSVNTAMQRCLAKAISLHGLGMYIYAGEDLPEVEQEKLSVPINDYQYQELNDLLIETESNLGAFCKHFKIGEVYELKQSDFNRAKTALEVKLAAGKSL